MRPPRFSAVLTLLVGIAFLAAACSNIGGSAGRAEVPDFEEEGPPPEDIVSAVGTVRYVELESNFYGLVADDSTRYIPDSLSTEFQEEGLRVRFRAVVKEDTVTAQQWGTPLEILKIRALPGY